LARVYIEPTSVCNLTCQTCIRNWISFDGANGVSFEDIRKGASFRQVIESLELLRKLNKKSPHKIDLGIAFVVMRKNIEDLKNIDRLIRATDARMISVSNVLPYTEEMERQMVCSQTLTLDTFTHVPGRADISLPRLDVTNTTKDAFLSLLRGYYNLSNMGNKISTETKQCGFIKDRCTFIRWDGKVVPVWDCCIPTSRFFMASSGLLSLTFLEI